MTASSHAQWLKQAARGNMTIPELFDAAAALTQQGQSQLAIDLYRHWIEHTKRSPLAYAAWFNLGSLLAAVNDDAGAEAAYRKCIALQARFIEGRLNLGTLLERQGKPQEALDMWRTILSPAVKIDKVTQRGLYLQTLNNLGRLLEIQKQYPEAEDMLAQSLRVDPSQVNVMTHWVHLRQKQCHWPTWAGLDHISRQQMEDGASALAMLSLTDNPDLQMAAAQRFVRDKMTADVPSLTDGKGYGHSRLRVGYLSSDLCSHAVSILTAELYGLHDRSQFEIYAFSWSRDDGSPLRARVVAGMDHYIPIHTLSDEQAAQLIRAQEIDILVDLHGLTSGARPQILAYHPATVQMTWLGFPGTTGLPGIDYVIADDFLITPEMEKDFTEKPLRLPDTFQINDRQRLVGNTPTRASVSLPEDAFVFCSFSNSYKYKPELFSHWMSILRRVPNSVLWLVADTPLVGENLKEHAKEAGIDPERLIFATRALPADYLARYRIADLFLDTYPFNGGTTASDALWAGLPVLTCSGPTFASRMAGSLLRAVDLPELITTSFSDYEELAVALANDPTRIAAMKQQLNANRMSCALFDTPRLVRNLEAAMKRVSAPTVSPTTMNPIDQIPMIAVSYNAPDLIASLLSTFRQHYPHNPVTIIDGSAPEIATQIAPICAQYEGVTFKPFGYNIHHGPGMAWAIENLQLSGRVLFLDSDVEILKRGFLESLDEHLKPGMYGVGNVSPVDENGQPHGPNSMAYLHPACMLTNIDVVRAWPLPIKHGAPMLPPMIALAKAGKSDLLGNVTWVNNDFAENPAQRIFIRHDWQGTVRRTGGYHYDKPSATPINTELLAFVPTNAIKVVQLGCGDGAFAKAYKQLNTVCNYTGIERDAIVAEQARAHCDFVFSQDFEAADEQRDRQLAQANCWVLDGALERVRDPWAVLQKIRSSIAADGTLVLSVRNFQHWSAQVRLNMGDFRYRADGVLQQDELRQFTRGSLLELLAQTGFRLTGGAPVIREEAGREVFLPILRQLAVASGSDPELSVQDALAQRYIITAVPA